MPLKLSANWIKFYEAVKDSSWPNIATQEDLLKLPDHIITELLFDHAFLDGVSDNIYSDQNSLISFSSIKAKLKDKKEYNQFSNHMVFDQIFLANDIKVHYNLELCGGGTTFGRYYPRVISKLYPGKTFDHCFEWCSGPGFIGFDILSQGLCNKLYLADIFDPAIESIRYTIEKNANRCKEHVFCYRAAAIQDLPSSWKFDLVVANPPHFNPDIGTVTATKVAALFDNRIAIDYGWNIHREFFENISKHLNPGAVILLQEDIRASGPEMFEHVIEQNGLYINDCYWESDIRASTHNPYLYYLEIKQN